MASHTAREEEAAINNTANVQDETPTDTAINSEPNSGETNSAVNAIQAIVCPSRLITGFNLPVILPILLPGSIPTGRNRDRGGGDAGGEVDEVWEVWCDSVLWGGVPEGRLGGA